MYSKYFLYIFLPLIIGYLSLKVFNNFRTTFLMDYVLHLEEDTLRILKTYTGAGEIHEVETEDGYILKLFRIPRTNPKGVILLQHNLFGDARMWISDYNDSTAFVFWRAGYDVWLGNCRGNVFGKKHRELQMGDRAFWDFTFHEMGYYDHVATAGYIKGNVNMKITYLGFSLGSTSGLIYASTRPKEAADTINLMLLIAPTAYNTHYRFTSLPKLIVPIAIRFQKFCNIGVDYPVMKLRAWRQRLYSFFNTVFPWEKCVGYFDDGISDPNLVDTTTWTSGSESSFKLLDHFGQLFMPGGRFHMYDYGVEQNLILYGTSNAPLYPLKDIKVPVFFTYGEYDEFIMVEDYEKLYDFLPKSSAIGKMMIEGFRHDDFLLSKQKNEKVYEKFLPIIGSFN